MVVHPETLLSLLIATIVNRYLLSYDAVSFHSYLETIIASNSTDKGTAKQNQSPWLFLDAANTLFQSAKRRAYLTKPKHPNSVTANNGQDGDEAEWAAVREAEEQANAKASDRGHRASRPSRTAGKWPGGVEPILEELPKWGLLGQVLEEIESHIAHEPIDSGECDPIVGFAISA
jgi:DNA excision repair protein ERCC-4